MLNERSIAVGFSHASIGSDERADASVPSGSWPRRAAGRLLRLPLFYKILVANAAAVALAAGLGAWLAASRGLGMPGGPTAWEAALLLAAASGLVSALVHVFLLRRALSPLGELARVISRLREEGPEAEVRARVPSTADRNLADLIGVFNGMLDTMSRYRSQLRRLAARTLAAAEAERRQIARILQEDTAQRLASLLVRLRVVGRTEDSELREAALEELRNEVAFALDSVRRTARALHPPELADIGLEQALRAYVRTLADADRGRHPEVAFEVDAVAGKLGEAGLVTLYRILREAICNAHLHAGATRVGVEVRRDGEWLRAVVQDDGRGLPPGSNGPGEEGLGLVTMRELALHAGGELRVVSRPGRGTNVVARVPLA